MAAAVLMLQQCQADELEVLVTFQMASLAVQEDQDQVAALLHRHNQAGHS